MPLHIWWVYFFIPKILNILCACNEYYFHFLFLFLKIKTDVFSEFCDIFRIGLLN